jgi:hypothetical protein
VSPSDTVGLGVAVFTIAMSALFALATTTTAVALLLVRLGTMFVAVAVAVSAMLVPEVVPAVTCKTKVKFAVAFRARLVPSVQVIVPAAPTAGVTHVHPAGGAMDWKFVLGGVV